MSVSNTRISQCSLVNPFLIQLYPQLMPFSAQQAWVPTHMYSLVVLAKTSNFDPHFTDFFWAFTQHCIAWHRSRMSLVISMSDYVVVWWRLVCHSRIHIASQDLDWMYLDSICHLMKYGRISSWYLLETQVGEFLYLHNCRQLYACWYILLTIYNPVV
jgi:hypothetical protein